MPGWLLLLKVSRIVSREMGTKVQRLDSSFYSHLFIGIFLSCEPFKSIRTNTNAGGIAKRFYIVGIDERVAYDDSSFNGSNVRIFFLSSLSIASHRDASSSYDISVKRVRARISR